MGGGVFFLRARWSRIWATDVAETAPRARASKEPVGVPDERLATTGERVDEAVGGGTDAAQAVTSAQLVGVALLAGERGQVRGVLQDGAAVVAACMPGDLVVGAIDEPDRGLRGNQRERHSDPVVRD